jgi:hypothetical protein
MSANFLKKYKREVTVGIIVFLFFLFRDLIKSIR